MNKFGKGQLVRVILTGEIGMVIDIYDKTLEGFESGYQVRLLDYSVRKFFAFELQKRD